MSVFFDDLSRIIASPMPRRQAFKLIGGALGGAVISSLGFGQADSTTSCPKGETQCGSGRNAICCRSGQTCCGNSTIGYICCPSSGGCCTDARQPYCSNANETCCRGICCNHGSKQTCCSNGTSGICCRADEVCCNGRCCTAGPSPKDPCDQAKCG
jgi:hypothetical protein